MALIATHRLPGMVLTSHRFEVPLDHARPGGETISVFAREVVAPGRENDDLPWLVFLQGGPGFEASRPPGNATWLPRALRDYHVLLLDQRGTGSSTPVTARTLARFGTPEAQAAYLAHFRADSIVDDAERIRRELLGPGKRWTVLGQSFGGFCAVHYLSAHPEGLEGAITTGGLPPLDRPADDVYRATYRRVAAKNHAYYERYPDDVARVQAIVRHLHEHPVRLPSGGILTPRRFQQLGNEFGGSQGFEAIHYLLEDAFVEGPDGPEPGHRFLAHLEAMQPFETNPLFAILHEAIYCQGDASNWSAHRVRAEYPEFEADPERQVLFTGEMVYPWMFEDYARLQPLREAAALLAAKSDWPQLYDVDRLRRNEVPVVAAIYYDDMYVERAFSEATAATIRGLRPWVTNEYEHDGLRADERVLDRLIGMLRGEV